MEVELRRKRELSSGPSPRDRKRPRPPMHCLRLKFSFSGEMIEQEVLFLIPALKHHCMPSLFIYNGTPSCADWARFSNILISSKLPPGVHHFVYAYCKAVVTAEGHFVSSRALNALLNVIGVEFKPADVSECQRGASDTILVNVMQYGG